MVDFVVLGLHLDLIILNVSDSMAEWSWGNQKLCGVEYDEGHEGQQEGCTLAAKQGLGKMRVCF